MTALVDTGATVSVVSQALAEKLGATVLPGQFSLDAARYAGSTFEMQLVARGCRPVRKQIVVDDGLAAKAAPKAQMILGTDHMQPRSGGVITTSRGDQVAREARGFSFAGARGSRRRR